jgi:hypothetical protein
MEYLRRIKGWIDLPTSKNYEREVRINEKTVSNHHFNSFLCNTDIHVSGLPVGTRKETG